MSLRCSPLPSIHLIANVGSARARSTHSIDPLMIFNVDSTPSLQQQVHNQHPSPECRPVQCRLTKLVLSVHVNLLALRFRVRAKYSTRRRYQLNLLRGVSLERDDMQGCGFTSAHKLHTSRSETIYIPHKLHTSRSETISALPISAASCSAFSPRPAHVLACQDPSRREESGITHQPPIERKTTS